MKTTLRVLCALAVAAGVVNAAPEKKKDDQVAASKQGKTKSSVSQTEKGKCRPQTGSRIQRTVDLSGRITDGPYQLIVITDEAIKRSGASSVAQVLNSYGVRH